MQQIKSKLVLLSHLFSKTPYKERTELVRAKLEFFTRKWTLNNNKVEFLTTMGEPAQYVQ